jgi:hypothetical protein
MQPRPSQAKKTRGEGQNNPLPPTKKAFHLGTIQSLPFPRVSMFMYLVVAESKKTLHRVPSPASLSLSLPERKGGISCQTPVYGTGGGRKRVYRMSFGGGRDVPPMLWRVKSALMICCVLVPYVRAPDAELPPAFFPGFHVSFFVLGDAFSLLASGGRIAFGRWI